MTTAVTWKWLYFRKRFHDPIRTGRKTHTLRSAKAAPVGGFVACPVGLLRILEVRKESPRRVGETLWAEEGCASPEDFFSEFDAIHPGVDLDKPLWLHRFQLVTEAGTACDAKGCPKPVRVAVAHGRIQICREHAEKWGRQEFFEVNVVD